MEHARQNAFDQKEKPFGRTIVLANFPPNDGRAARHAAVLGCALDQAGYAVVTVSEPDGSFARLALDYRSRRTLAQSRERVIDAMEGGADLVLYASALRTDTIVKPTWFTRQSEKIRRWKLATAVALGAQKTTLVFDVGNPFRATFWIALAVAITISLRRPSGFCLAFLHHSPEKICEFITGKPCATVDASRADDLVFSLAFKNTLSQNKARLSPEWLIAVTRFKRRIGGSDEKLLSDADAICTDVRNTPRRYYKHLDYIGVISGPLNDSRSDSKRQHANEKPAGELLSRFARHYRSNLPERANLAGIASSNDTEFMRWYTEHDFPNNAVPALPLPTQESRQICSTLSTPNVLTAIRIIDIARRSDTLEGLSPELVHHYSKPLGGKIGNLSAMEMLTAVLAGFAIPDPDMMLNPWNAPQIRSWFNDVLCNLAPGLSIFSTSGVPRNACSDNTIKIAGIVRGQSGLARNSNMHAKALRYLGLRPELRPLNDLSCAQITPAPLNTRARRSLLRNAVIHNVNADGIPQQRLSREVSGNDTAHIGYLLWETPDVPASHLLAKDLLDEIWVPSRFVQNIYQTAYDRPVHKVGKAITLPKITPADLTHCGIHPDHRLFLTIFDANSSVERKNPLAAVLAFLDAFPGRLDVRMMVKYVPARAGHWGDRNGQLRQIRKLADKDPRIILEASVLSFHDLLAYISRADCIVSPHRAEGFGYIPAFALSLARPVIATDYSGTCDFCSTRTAFPVPFAPVEIRRNEFIDSAKGSTWAAIDRSALVTTLQQVDADYISALDRARAGQAFMQENYSTKRLADIYETRLRALGVLG